MPRKQNNNQSLNELLAHSRAVKMLIPTFQQTLQDLAQKGDATMQRAITMILKREDTSDLQSVYFIEKMLRDFLAINFPSPDPQTLLREYRDLAYRLVQTFLFFDTEDKKQILPLIEKMKLPALRDLIELFRNGHRKQEDYLLTFAEKDPKLAVKFKVLVATATTTGKPDKKHK